MYVGAVAFLQAEEIGEGADLRPGAEATVLCRNGAVGLRGIGWNPAPPLRRAR